MSKISTVLLSVLMLILFSCLGCSTRQKTSDADYHQWAPTPPMGWNSWDCFGCTVTEQEVKQNADYMAANLKDYGWQYIVVDIQWYEPQSNKQSNRPYDYPPNLQSNIDQYGRLWPAPIKHPSSVDGNGFNPLADYVHAKGLKFGVHLMRGIPKRAVEKNTPILGTPYYAADIADKTSTCPWNPDMYGVDMSKPGAQEYYNSVFDLLAKWHVDYVKIDDLSRPYHQSEIEAIRKAIDQTGRPMVFSTSPGETPLSAGPHVWQHANLWRISDDFWDDWRALKSQFKRLHDWTPWRGDGFYPDADMLPLANVRAREKNAWTRFTHDEQVTMMTLWAIARSPLMMGGHMPKNDDWTLSLLTHSEMLAVNQHSTAGRQLFRENDLIAWIAEDSQSDDLFLALFNAQDAGEIDQSRAKWKSPVMTRQSSEKLINVDIELNGAEKLYLAVDDTGDGLSWDHANWLHPQLISQDGSIIKLTDLKWINASAGWGVTKIDKSISNRDLLIDGKQYWGIGTHANSLIEYDLPKGCRRFQALVALDQAGTSQANSGATIRFSVFTENPMPTVSDASEITVSLAELGITGKFKIRDIWKKTDIGVFEDTFSSTIARHNAGLYRITKE